MEHDVATGLSAADPGPVEPDVLLEVIDESTELLYDLSVHFDTSFENEPFGGTTRNDPGARQDFLKTLLHGGRGWSRL